MGTFVTIQGIDSKATHSIEVCVSTHTALRISLPLCQQVNYAFYIWPIRTINWLVAASKLHINSRRFVQLNGPTVHSLYCAFVCGREWLTPVRAKCTCEMLDFGAVKCDLFYPLEA